MLQVERAIDVGPAPLDPTPFGAPEIRLDADPFDYGPAVQMGWTVWPADITASGTPTNRSMPASFVEANGDRNGLGHNYGLRLQTQSALEVANGHVGWVQVKAGDSLEPPVPIPGPLPGDILLQAGGYLNPSACIFGVDCPGDVWLTPGIDVTVPPYVAASFGFVRIADPLAATPASLRGALPLPPLTTVGGDIYFATPQGQVQVTITIGMNPAAVVAAFLNPIQGYGLLAASIAGGGELLLTTTDDGPLSDILYVGEVPAGTLLTVDLGEMRVAGGAVYTPGTYPDYINMHVQTNGIFHLGEPDTSNPGWMPLIYDANTGKLTVPGLIDPTGLIMDSEIAGNVPTAASQGAIFTDGAALWFKPQNDGAAINVTSGAAPTGDPNTAAYFDNGGALTDNTDYSYVEATKLLSVGITDAVDDIKVPFKVFHHNSGAAAFPQGVGIDLEITNDAGAHFIAAQIVAAANDYTSGSEEGAFVVQIEGEDGLTPRLTLNSTKAIIRRNDGQDLSDIKEQLDIVRHANGATVLDGFGSGIRWTLEDDTQTDQEAAWISGVMTDVTAASWAGALTFETAGFGGSGERMRIDHTGQVGIGRVPAPAFVTGSDAGTSLQVGIPDDYEKQILAAMSLSHELVTKVPGGGGYGIGIDFSLENSAGPGNLVLQGQFQLAQPLSTAGSEDTEYRWRLMDGGTLTEKMRLSSDGSLAVGDSTSPTNKLIVTDSNTDTALVTPVAKFVHAIDAAGSGAIGAGASIVFRSPISAGGVDGVELGSVMTNVTGAASVSDFFINQRITSGGPAVETIRVQGVTEGGSNYQGRLGINTVTPEGAVHAILTDNLNNSARIVATFDHQTTATPVSDFATRVDLKVDGNDAVAFEAHRPDATGDAYLGLHVQDTTGGSGLIERARLDGKGFTVGGQPRSGIINAVASLPDVGVIATMFEATLVQKSSVGIVGQGIRQDFIMMDDGGTEVSFGELSSQATNITAAGYEADLIFKVAQAGGSVEAFRIDGGTGGFSINSTSPEGMFKVNEILNNNIVETVARLDHTRDDAGSGNNMGAALDLRASYDASDNPSVAARISGLFNNAASRYGTALIEVASGASAVDGIQIVHDGTNNKILGSAEPGVAASWTSMLNGGVGSVNYSTTKGTGITGTHTVAQGDYYLGCNTGTTTSQINLPETKAAGAIEGREIIIKDEGTSSGNAITVTGAAANVVIEGAAPPYTINVDKKGIKLMCMGINAGKSEWWIVAQV